MRLSEIRASITDFQGLTIPDPPVLQVGAYIPVCKLYFRIRPEQVHICLPVLFNGPGVSPVSLELVAIHPAILIHHSGYDVTAEFIGCVFLDICFKNFIEHLGFKTENRQWRPSYIQDFPAFPCSAQPCRPNPRLHHQYPPNRNGGPHPSAP